MTDFRRAHAESHPAKTNTAMLAVVIFLILIVSMQIWLLTAGLNTSLGGDRSIAWPAFYASLALFAGAVGLLRYLPHPIRVATVEAREKAEAFPDAALAWRTLAISTVSLSLAFAVWFLWSALALKLAAAGFHVNASQAFWLTATPVLLGSFLRIPYGVIVSKYGSRKSFTVVTALLAVPCVGAGLALRDPATSFGTLLFWSAVTGIAGANFATSMAVVTLWFPKKRQGMALGVNGLGNLGVTVAQFVIPAVIGVGVFATILGPSQAFTGPKGAQSTVWLQNAAFVWIPAILVCALAIWFGTKDFAIPPKTIASQLRVARDLHTWTISFLYFLTFGCFVAMGASLPLIIQAVFAKAPGGAPNPLLYAPFAPLVATILRPVGGWAADRLGAARVTAFAIAVMGVGGFGLSQFLTPESFRGFFVTIVVICGASGIGNGSVFKIIPTVNPKEAGAVIGFVSCLGALGGFFPPLLLGWCLTNLGSPALAYTAMALFAIAGFVVNWWFYGREGSPTRC